MNSTPIAMAGVAIALETERLNAERIASLEQQLEQQRTESAARAAEYREKVIALLNHIEVVVDEPNWERIDHGLWNAVTALPAPTVEAPSKTGVISFGEVDMARAKLAAARIGSYLLARGRSPGASDIISIHAPTACILNETDLALVLAAFSTFPPAENNAWKQAVGRLTRKPMQPAGAVDWVNCPVCKEPDMHRTVDEDDNALIECVNHSCLSNGGTSQG